MNLTKHDPETEMEMNMTPMIDVVFLLIIFFMIITDMTQQDLEELKLPLAIEADEDKPDPKEVRPVVNIMWDGRMVVKRKDIYTPEQEENYSQLEGYLADQSSKMEKEHFNKEAQTGPMIPAGKLLIRADENTDFHFIQKVMEICGKKGIQIWKVQLAAATPEKEDE